MDIQTEILAMHVVGGAITFAMLLVAVRWFAPYLELDLSLPSRRWIAVVDPPIDLARRLLGQTMGPFDWAPVAVLLCLWVARLILAGF